MVPRRTVIMDAMTVTARASSGGFELAVELDRTDLLPGRLVDGRATITARGAEEIRGARVTLVGTETYRYDRTETDSKGDSRTVTETATHELPPVPVALLGPTSFGVGETRTVPFQLPVPGLGPPSFEGSAELKIEWEVRLNLDVPMFDPTVILPVRVLQPTALLRAGVVHVGEFALYPEADVADGDLVGSVWLDPVPLVIGATFSGRLTLAAGSPRDVQEVRLEIRVRAKATVSGGRAETVTLWTGRLAPAGTFGGTAAVYAFEGTVPDIALPTMESPHGRSDGTFSVVVAIKWAGDPNLVRDVAICTTAEL
jgi:hypothetical protein